ncbi:MAG TPA: VOC family protein [Chloroflexota bacterium]|nr:VOC family protein [Chloroflexota bacterium]
MIRRIKHMAVAVKDVDAALATYQQRLGVGEARRLEWAKGRSREAHFPFGEVEIQLCQSTDPEGRFAQHIAHYGEGVQHMCLEVDNIEQAIKEAVADGAVLKPCSACNVTGPHPHSEGYVAFLAGQAVPGFELEFMQVYKEGERPADFAKGS